jgi:hypothetical protein
MSAIDIAVNHRTSAQNEPDLRKCYKFGYPNSGFHILQKNRDLFHNVYRSHTAQSL